MRFEVMDDEVEAGAQIGAALDVAALDAVTSALSGIRSAIAGYRALEASLFSLALELAESAAEHAPRRQRERDMALRTVAAELAAALHTSDRTVQRRLSDSWALTHRFSHTHLALAAGRIELAHASAIIDVGGQIDDDAQRAAFEQSGVAVAEVESPGRLRAMLGALAEQARPVGITERHRAARAQRCVTVRDTTDGMAELFAVLPVTLAHGIHDRLTAMAHGVRSASRTGVGQDHARSNERTLTRGAIRDEGLDGLDAPADERTVDHLRADILCDLALGGGPVAFGDGLAAIRAHVQVTVPVLSLIGAADGGDDGEGGVLAGSGPIDAVTARSLAGAATSWDRVLTHPITAAVLTVDRYRPTRAMRRTLRVRDEHCRFPGCRQPIWRCDTDHTIEAARGGPTTIGNLAHLCRRHHSLKHASTWTVRQRPGGLMEWTSPTGRTYTDSPPTAVRFVAATDPPPF